MGERPISGRRTFARVLGGAALAIGCGDRARDSAAPTEPVVTPTEPPAQRERLRALLADDRARDPEYQGGLSNHLPMALVALAELGADDARLVAFADRYGKRLDPMRELGEPLPWTHWRDGLGRHDAFGGLLGAFDRRLRERGRDEVLAEALPVLVPSVGALLFHGLLRAAYAVRVNDDEELAHGLAYWATAATPLRPLPPRTSARATPLELAKAAWSDPALAGAIRGGPSMTRMRTVAARKGFDAKIADAELGDDRRALAEMALTTYLGTGDFIAIHLVTGTQALDVLWPYLDDHELALRWHWQSLFAAALTIDAPRAPEAIEPPTWAAIHARAIESDDDHDVKLVDACTQDRGLGEDVRWRHAAALRLRMV
jgi:hypothetical protein